jgi:hypothetical protein
MNQRIRELHSQCKVCDKDTVLYFDYEKFAELIVRECIRELEISRKCDPYTGELFDCEYNTCIKEQSVMLKEHFGVEE